MAQEQYFTGDTIRAKVTFRDWVPTGSPTPGALINPDSVQVNTYGSDLALIENIPAGSPKITNPSTGVYIFDWVLPTTASSYFLEFKGIYNDPVQTEPCIIRKKIVVKFKPAE